MTHEELRKRAVRWLTKKCPVVLSELVSANVEIPDAIGWNNGHSVLVECKISRSDFLANANKCFIRSDRGMGNKRYFLTPPDLISAEDCTGDYGLLWAMDDGYIKVVKEATHRESFEKGEIVMLVSALRRVRAREFIVLSDCREESEAQTQ